MINTGMIWGTALPTGELSNGPTWNEYLDGCPDIGGPSAADETGMVPGKCGRAQVVQTSGTTRCELTRIAIARWLGRPRTGFLRRTHHGANIHV